MKLIAYGDHRDLIRIKPGPDDYVRLSAEVAAHTVNVARLEVLLRRATANLRDAVDALHRDTSSAMSGRNSAKE